jgi:hypothetical protein
MSVGTFGWWAGYFLTGTNKKSRVVYYAKADKDWDKGWFVPEDHFPPSWIAMS